MRKVKMTSSIRKALKRWLQLPREERGGNCPFKDLRFEHICSICITVFPSLAGEIRWDGSRKFLDTKDCPCAVLSYSYVVKKAKEIVEGK